MINTDRKPNNNTLDSLSFLATHRKGSLFEEDLNICTTQIQEKITGKRILVIGGAGSIGAATIHEIVPFSPEALHVVDTNENNLAELVRGIRNNNQVFDVSDFRTLPLDFGSSVMQRFVAEQIPYDMIFNFAAIKHVRSEKDVYSILQMIDTNVLKPARLLKWLAEKGDLKSYFCVSTDKAANPTNLMGATKRLMEHIIFSSAVIPELSARTTSARFANVAFSDGSLLYSWIKRMESRQPLAVPGGTRRFFISLQEAGKICLIAAACANDKHLLIPRFSPQTDLKELQSIAESFLRFHGYEPRLYNVETDAKANIESDIAETKYPLLITPLDTVGEKPDEEFLGEGEHIVETGLVDLLEVQYKSCDRENLQRFLSAAMKWVSDPRGSITKKAIISSISSVIPELSHKESEKTLDERM